MRDGDLGAADSLFSERFALAVEVDNGVANRWAARDQTARVHRLSRPALVLLIAALAFGSSVAGAARSGDLRDDFASFDVQ